MFVYIIRHGEAHNDSDSGRDRDRELTELGHRQAWAAGAYLAGLGYGVKGSLLVVASPFTRAQETGIEVCNELGIELKTDDLLGADYGLTEMLSVVESHIDQQAIAIVSHMPTVGMFETMLTGGIAERAGSLLTGQVVKVRVDPDELVGSGEVVDRYRLES